jgi:hypothetical protein
VRRSRRGSTRVEALCGHLMAGHRLEARSMVRVHIWPHHWRNMILPCSCCVCGIMHRSRRGLFIHVVAAAVLIIEMKELRRLAVRRRPRARRAEGAYRRLWRWRALLRLYQLAELFRLENGVESVLWPHGYRPLDDAACDADGCDRGDEDEESCAHKEGKEAEHVEVDEDCGRLAGEWWRR